jgi:sugar lactone lactonase YvrE
MLAFGLLLILCVGVGSALADDLGTGTSALPTSNEIIETIENGAAQAIDVQPTDPLVAESLPHQDLGRTEALELLHGVFEAQLEAPAGVFDELSVERFLAPNVAVIPGTEPTDVPATSQAPAATGDEGDAVEPPLSMAMKDDLRAASSDSSDGDGGIGPDANEAMAQIQGATLLESSIPLRMEAPSGQQEAIDLGLEHRDGELQPANPLVEVGIPEQLGEGIELSDLGVTIEIVGAPEERSPSIVEGSVAFMPNIAPDTDLAVAPTPTGVETFTQLRSAASPRTQTFALQLPSDAALQATEDGGAAVLSDEETLLSIAPPTAIDASGADVPVDLEVAESTFTLTVAPDSSAQFPVLVDPLIQTYEWASSTPGQNGICSNSTKYEGPSFSCNNREEWGYEVIDKDGNLPAGISVSNRAYNGPVPYGTPGLVLDSSHNSSGMLTTGDRGSAIYTVPRYFTDQSKYGTRPTSFISHMTLWNLDWDAWSSSLSPYLFAGIWDPVKPGWVSSYSHEGLNGHGVHNMSWKYEFSNSQPNTNAKVGYVSVQATSTGPNQNTEAYVGSASVQLADNGVPGFGSISGPSGWINQTATPISFVTSDSGLGVYSLRAGSEQESEQGVPLYSWKTSYGCIGVSGAPCPRTWSSADAGSPPLIYEPSAIPTGISYLKVIAEDPVGNKSAPAYAQIKVDHAAPHLALSGTMTEQETLGVKRPSYTLRVDASDGTPEQPQSGASNVTIKVDGTVVDEVAPGCATKSCGISREWTLDASNYAAGQHTITVATTDGVGLSTTKTLPIELDPSPPSLSLAGTLTEQATLGTSRPRYKLKVDASAIAGREGLETGEPLFLSSFGSNGSGNGQFSHPAGIVLDPKGNLWVVDQDNDRVQKFSADGQYLSSFGSSGVGDGQFDRPTSIAIDPKGNLWVTDAGNNRIQKFSESGAFLAKFGSTGSGNGQFSGPEGIAVDPKGNVWVADTYNGRLQKFDENGQFVKVISSKGSAQGQLGEPTDLDVGPSGKVWVADWQNNRVSVFQRKRRLPLPVRVLRFGQWAVQQARCARRRHQRQRLGRRPEQRASPAVQPKRRIPRQVRVQRLGRGSVQLRMADGDRDRLGRQSLGRGHGQQPNPEMEPARIPPHL